MDANAEKIQQWKKELTQITGQFDQEFGNLGANQLNWKPGADTWSIAQNIDHILTTNKSYLLIPEKIRKGSYKVPFLGKFKFITNFFGKEILKGVRPERDKKIKTFRVWEPAQSDLPENILEEFKATQKQLLTMIEASGDLLEKNTVISSPANKNIVYSLEAAFEIIISHEKRHFNQAKEVLSLMPTNI